MFDKYAGITNIYVAETVMKGQTACGWPLGSVSIRLWRITERSHVIFDFFCCDVSRRRADQHGVRRHLGRHTTGIPTRPQAALQDR